MRKNIELSCCWEKVVDRVEFFVVPDKFCSFRCLVVLKLCNLHVDSLQKRVIDSGRNNCNFEVSRVLKLNDIVIIERSLHHFIDVYVFPGI